MKIVVYNLHLILNKFTVTGVDDKKITGNKRKKDRDKENERDTQR